MPKTKASAKSKSTNSNKGLVKVGKLKFDKTLLIVTAAVVVAFGGYLLYKGTHAATTPPQIYGATKLVDFTATDGVRSYNTGGIGGVYGQCMRFVAASAFGNITLCGQRQVLSDNGTTVTYRVRTLMHSFVNGAYAPIGDWVTVTDSSGGKGGGASTNYLFFCNNTANPFAAIEYVTQSAFGPVVMGTQYHYVSAGRYWTVNFTNYSQVNHTCSNNNVWYKMVGTW